MRVAVVTAAVSAILALYGLTGCIVEKKADVDASEHSQVDPGQNGVSPSSTEKGPFERVGARMDKGAKKLDAAIEKGAGELGEAMERAGQELQEKSAEAQRRRQEQAAQPDVNVEIKVEKP